jgi:hypothetical protein
LGTSASSSPNYNITTGNDDNGDFSANDRPPGVTRNSERAEPLWTVDARLSKVIDFGNFNAELLIEAFNLFNRANVGNFNGVLASSNFGEPTGVVTGYEPRQVQLGFRVDF